MPKSARIVATREIRACQFCQRSAEEEMKLGKLHSLGTISAHHYCLLFSSALSQQGKEDDEGILGFLPKDISAEIRRGKRLRCSYCKSTGATIGCVCKKCPRAYHLPCGLENDALLQFFGTFPTYCKDHRFSQKPIEWKDRKAGCAICLDEVVAKVAPDTLYPPCCKNGWFHKSCIQTQALKSGYFFRCPLCNNQMEFNEEMEKFGVYIPEQDASWEQEPGAFSDMYEQHSSCDAFKCNCPRGRDFDEDTTGESIWELVRCQTCGSQGTHIGCSNLPLTSPQWTCTNCLPIVDRLEEVSKKSKHVVRRRKRGRKKRNSRLQARLKKRHRSPSPNSSSSSPDVRRSSSNLHSPTRSGVSHNEIRANVRRTRSSRTWTNQQEGIQPLSSDSSRPSSPVFVGNENFIVTSPTQSSISRIRERRESSSSSKSVIKDQDKVFPSDSSSCQLINIQVNLKRSATWISSSSSETSETLPPIKKRNLIETPVNQVLSIHDPSSSGLHLQRQEDLDRSVTREDESTDLKLSLPLVAEEPDITVLELEDTSDDSAKEDNPLRENDLCTTLGNRNGESFVQHEANFSPCNNRNPRKSMVHYKSAKENQIASETKDTSISDKHISRGQLSILQYMQNNSNKLSPCVMQRKVKCKKVPSKLPSLKITSFFQPQLKVQVFSEDDNEENTAPVT